MLKQHRNFRPTLPGLTKNNQVRGYAPLLCPCHFDPSLHSPFDQLFSSFLLLFSPCSASWCLSLGLTLNFLINMCKCVSIEHWKGSLGTLSHIHTHTHSSHSHSHTQIPIHKGRSKWRKRGTEKGAAKKQKPQQKQAGERWNSFWPFSGYKTRHNFELHTLSETGQIKFKTELNVDIHVGIANYIQLEFSNAI